MVEYFYHFDYEAGCTCSATKNVQQASAEAASTTTPVTSVVISSSTMLEHAKVFAMVVKYQVNGLRDLAVSKFAQAVKAGWDHENFANTIFTVYNSTTDDVKELREIVADTIFTHFDTLKKKEEIEAVVSSIGSLAYSLLKRSGTKTCKNK